MFGLVWLSAKTVGFQPFVPVLLELMILQTFINNK